MNENTIPTRNEIEEKDTWDLSGLYTNVDAFKSDLARLDSLVLEASRFKGQFTKSKEAFLEALEWVSTTGQLSERLGNYAFLNYVTEINNPEYQSLIGLYQMKATSLAAASSFIEPEIMACEEVPSWIKEPEFADFRVYVEKMLRFKPHILSDAEEALLASESELQETPSKAFEALTNVDMDFGEVDCKALTQTTYSVFLQNPDDSVREKAYKQFYSVYRNHAETLASLYSGSVKQDVFNARVRGYASSLDMALFRDRMPESVYMNLIEAVHRSLPVLHRYYSLKRKMCALDTLNHWDVYLPMVKEVKTRHSYSEACGIVCEALAPLGTEYVETLRAGLLTDRWVDIYENKGKRSGAFSSGGYEGNPYILLNYNENLLGDVFTVAHEGGHSMHTLYSKRNNPFTSYSYTIFEAEVASTFNETLLSEYLLKHSESKEMSLYLVSKQLDDIVATLFRQTMFAEFELLCHKAEEEGSVLTLDLIRRIYRGLLTTYFGPEMHFEDESDLECLRIPHFYNAFYVYKYATGISAAINLSEGVLEGSAAEREEARGRYLDFLKSGGKRYPLESLRLAGVDMESAEPILFAVRKFSGLLDEIERMV